MKKYFKEEKTLKIDLKKYWIKIGKEYLKVEEELKKYLTAEHVTEKEKILIEELKLKKEDLSLAYARVKHIYHSLGEVQIREDMIDTFFETFDSSKSRYGTICLKQKTIKAIYEISEMFPELSKEALLLIDRLYIKDLFDKYSLIEVLSIMIRRDGMKDSTFEKFIDKVKELADKEDKKYSDVASCIRIYCGEYPYDFVRHFEKFVKEHHISWERFYECLPSPELILKDQLELKALTKKTKDCWMICEPITYQMLEDYLDGDIGLSRYEEQLSYYITTYDEKAPTTFTKTEFIESMKKTRK